MKSEGLHGDRVKTINLCADARKKSSGQFRSEFRLQAVCAAREFLRPRKRGTQNKKKPFVVRADEKFNCVFETEIGNWRRQTDLH